MTASARCAHLQLAADLYAAGVATMRTAACRMPCAASYARTASRGGWRARPSAARAHCSTCCSSVVCCPSWIRRHLPGDYEKKRFRVHLARETADLVPSVGQVRFDLHQRLAEWTREMERAVAARREAVARRLEQQDSVPVGQRCGRSWPHWTAAPPVARSVLGR